MLLRISYISLLYNRHLIKEKGGAVGGIGDKADFASAVFDFDTFKGYFGKGIARRERAGVFRAVRQGVHLGFAQ